MASKGLEGVVAAETSLSQVLGEEGRLIYAGYDIEDLAQRVTFEEVCHLLWFGELPTRAQLEDLRGRMRSEGRAETRVLDLVRLLPTDTHPMAALRTGLSALGNFDLASEDLSKQETLRKSIRITAQLPVLTAAFHRHRSGLDPVQPREDLGLAANFLWMLTGEEPDELSARIMDVALTLHAEHGLNASTFAARVAIATLTDVYSAVTAAIGTLKGPLHGGANQRVMESLQAVGSPEEAESWVKAALDRKEKVMGFGHRVYRTLDPRAPILKELAAALAERRGDSRWLDIADRVNRTMREEMDRREKRIYANVDFYSAPVYFTLGIPTDTFTNIFAIARAAGWTAHIMEQLKDNRLIRPRAEYVGSEDRKVRPIEERG